MHDCPECGGNCGCDGEDHHQPAPEYCAHVCPDDDEDDWDDDYDDDFEDES